MGDTYLAHGDLQEAEATYRQALKLEKDNVELMDCLSDVLQKQERYDEAADMYDQLLAIDPNNATAAHFAAALRGRNTDAPPAKFVQDLFNDFAPNFEETLVKELSYDVPNLICQALKKLHEDDIISLPFNRALDLGCGTGLVGQAFKNADQCIVNELHGVDIAEDMIAEAEKKRVYDLLNTVEIIEYLTQHDTSLPYDFIAAADVFVYLGSLEAAFSAVHACLAESGVFVFSVESLPSGTYALHRTGRYAHHSDYIKSLAAKSGFSVQDCQEIVVRKERSLPIAGLLFILIKN